MDLHYWKQMGSICVLVMRDDQGQLLQHCSAAWAEQHWYLWAGKDVEIVASMRQNFWHPKSLFSKANNTDEQLTAATT